MPAISDRSRESFPADYVFRETKRCVEGIQGKAAVYPGQEKPTDPERLYDTVIKSFEAGADGIMISLEYDEMRKSSLDAIGKAIKAIRKENG